MIYTTIDNFYLSEDELRNSPSRADGISQEIETQLRIYGCEVIQEGGVLLKLPQAVMATGQVLLQRFYCKESLLKFNIKRVAWACCWLATKLEENPRRIRDVLSVFVRIDKRREGKPLNPLDIYSTEFNIRKQELINVERHLLRSFGFVLHVDHPHKFVLNYCRLLEANKDLKQETWNLANDSLRTTVCVRFKAHTVACGILFLAARRLKIALPENPPWWQLFQVDKNEMLIVAKEVHALLQRPKPTYISVYRGQHNSPKPGNDKELTPMVSPGGQGTSETSRPTSDQDTNSMGVKDVAAEGVVSGGSAERNSKQSQEGALEKSGRKRGRDGDEESKRAKSKRSKRDRHQDGEHHKHRRHESHKSERHSREREHDSEREHDRKKDRREREERDWDRDQDRNRDRHKHHKDRDKRRSKEKEDSLRDRV